MKILKVKHKIPPGNFSLAGIRLKIVFNGMTYCHTEYKVFITARGIFTPICSTIKAKESQFMDDLAPFKKLISFFFQPFFVELSVTAQQCYGNRILLFDK